MPEDIIDDLLRELRPHVTLDEWHRKAYELRQKWGGEAVYIRKAPADQKAFLQAEAEARGATFAESCEAAGCGRRHGYYLRRRRA